jgi:rod shape-determining protein MreD
MSTPARTVLAGLLVLLAVVLQTSVLPLLAGGAPLPHLCLLVVVAVGLSTGETPGAVAGFAAGLTLDLVPPADDLAGRWALALALAGFLAGHLATRTPARTPTRTAVRSWRTRLAMTPQVAVVTGAASFVATSVFALTGLVFGELSWSVPELLRGVLVAVTVDIVAGVLVVPPMLRALGAVDAPALALDGSR